MGEYGSRNRFWVANFLEFSEIKKEFNAVVQSSGVITDFPLRRNTAHRIHAPLNLEKAVVDQAAWSLFHQTLSAIERYVLARGSVNYVAGTCLDLEATYPLVHCWFPEVFRQRSLHCL